VLCLRFKTFISERTDNAIHDEEFQMPTFKIRSSHKIKKPTKPHIKCIETGEFDFLNFYWFSLTHASNIEQTTLIIVVQSLRFIEKKGIN